jgi:hypothetical protein
LAFPRGVPHVHSREEEGFYVLEGEITFTHRGDQRLVASAGTFANIPVEKMFFEFGVSLPEGATTTTALPLTQQEIERLLAVAPKYGIEIRLPGP